MPSTHCRPLSCCDTGPLLPLGSKLPGLPAKPLPGDAKALRRGSCADGQRCLRSLACRRQGGHSSSTSVPGHRESPSCHSTARPPGRARTPHTVTSPVASAARLRSTAAASDLAADKTHGAAAKICCNKDAGGFPGWLPSTQAVLCARLLGHRGRKAAAEMGGGKGGKEGVLAELTC